jgi:radical SAM protein with 4Fe4S-binding SPASM domain
MGCIGYPSHPAWEVTSACNLKCIHCHAKQSEPGVDDLTTKEAKKFIDELRKVNEFRMLVYTGGEPLVRGDLMELLAYSYKAGFANVIATNGTLITDEVALELKKSGVAGIAVSLDATKEDLHDEIRGTNSFNLAMRGIEAVKKAGIPLQINVTAMKYNLSNLEDLIELADEKSATIMLMYQLIAVGRADTIKTAALDIDLNKQLLSMIKKKQRNVSVIVEPVAGPQYWPYLLKERGLTGKIWLKLAEKVFHGCSAGRGFVYIKANGDVWPCPFVEVKAGNVKETPFSKIWSDSEVFSQLRNRENLLKGKCGRCEYRKMCGGCRGRAMACGGDLLGEDPSCFIK